MPQVNAKAANPDRPPQRALALLLAGVAGAAVMVVELGVARILTPVFGGSITVWALAAGYAFGGRRADVSGGMRVARCGCCCTHHSASPSPDSIWTT